MLLIIQHLRLSSLFEDSKLWQRMLAVLGRDDGNPTSLPRAGLSSNHDVDVVIECRQQLHQAFEREAASLLAVSNL